MFSFEQNCSATDLECVGGKGRGRRSAAAEFDRAHKRASNGTNETSDASTGIGAGSAYEAAVSEKPDGHRPSGATTSADDGNSGDRW